MPDVLIAIGGLVLAFVAMVWHDSRRYSSGRNASRALRDAGVEPRGRGRL